MSRREPTIFFRKTHRVGKVSRLLGLLLVLGTPATMLAHGTFHARLAALNERLGVAPADAALHFALAELYCEHEQPADALRELDRVEALGVGELPLDYLRGMSLRLAGAPEAGLTCLDRFVAAHPDNVPGRLQRARVHHALGNERASLIDYREAMALSMRPEPDLVQETADALARNGLVPEALEVLGQGIAKLGPIPSLALRAMDLEISSGRFEAALSRIDVLQKTAPRPEPWMAKRATVLTQAGHLAEARAAWEALLARIASLPNLERGSHSMSRIAEQAQQALAALKGSS